MPLVGVTSAASTRSSSAVVSTDGRAAGGVAGGVGCCTRRATEAENGVSTVGVGLASVGEVVVGAGPMVSRTFSQTVAGGCWVYVGCIAPSVVPPSGHGTKMGTYLYSG